KRCPSPSRRVIPPRASTRRRSRSRSTRFSSGRTTRTTCATTRRRSLARGTRSRRVSSLSAKYLGRLGSHVLKSGPCGVARVDVGERSYDRRSRTAHRRPHRAERVQLLFVRAQLRKAREHRLLEVV